MSDEQRNVNVRGEPPTFGILLTNFHVWCRVARGARLKEDRLVRGKRS